MADEKTPPLDALPVANLSASEQIMHSTVRLELPEFNRSGTGFFYTFFQKDNLNYPAIVTNYHVLAGATSVSFRLTVAGPDRMPMLGNTISIKVENLAQRMVVHPDADLAAILIGDLISQSAATGKIPFFVPLTQSLIPTTDVLQHLAPLESVLTVGYPGQLWDDVNNLPIFHRGNTATAPYIPFKGKREFLVDFATWPGASGSPVFVFNEGSYFDSRSGSLNMGSSRILLIGVVYGVAVQEVTGTVVIAKAPVGFKATDMLSASNVPTNLGACLQASRIPELERELFKLGISAPAGYIFR